MAQTKKRDAFFDNARAILIFLVVFGHLIQPYTDAHPTVYALYLLIYSFHMPAFLFISGYFAKNVGRAGY
ncbi:acyltransferase family protein, partial [Staphylococcus pseudintermedius]